MQGTAREVFGVFLKLGLTSFGGPVAHLGYFRDELVLRRRWLDEARYAELVALCQFLPGPTSSQVGFALGLSRAGWLGALAAFVAFTLPSALLMGVFGLFALGLDGPLAAGLLHGLKLVAVAIVAQAVWGMAQSLCPDGPRAGVALGAVALLAFVPGTAGMIGAIVVGALAGLALPRGGAPAPGAPLPVVATWGALVALVAVSGLLAGLPLLASLAPGLALADAVARAGALVFGGGHVVLPLLEAGVVGPGLVSQDSFLAGYGAAQAMPGPLFTFAAYLGAVAAGPLGALLALAAVFLPGFLILIAALPVWSRLRALPAARSLVAGANAAVVGVLGAALYDPVFTTSVQGLKDLALALACLVALMVWKQPPWRVVLLGAAGGIALALIPAV